MLDAYSDARFDPRFDRETGYVTRSVLCLPIFSDGGAVIGVIQLVNKLMRTGADTDGFPTGGLDPAGFQRMEEARFRAFAVFCGMAVANGQR